MKIADLLSAFNSSKVLPDARDDLNSGRSSEQAGLSPITQLRTDDIFIVGFPKSGNTWMQNLVAGLLYGIDTKYLPDKLTQLLVPNVHGTTVYKRVSDATCFKSHFLPRPEYRRVVYLVRDGRDAMVSYFHMNKAVLDTPVSLQEMVISAEGVFPCKWHEHVQQWESNPFDAEMIFIRYEDLHRQPVVELQKFCRFAGIDRPMEVLERSIAGNQFEQMQAKEEKFGWENCNWNRDEKFIRKGQIGGYRQEMPIELIEFFEQESRTQLLRFGYPIDG